MGKKLPCGVWGPEQPRLKDISIAAIRLRLALSSTWSSSEDAGYFTLSQARR